MVFEDPENTMPDRVGDALHQVAINRYGEPKVIEISVELCHGDPSRGIHPHYVTVGVSVPLDQMNALIPQLSEDMQGKIQFMPKVIRTYPTDSPCPDCREKLGMEQIKIFDLMIESVNNINYA